MDTITFNGKEYLVREAQLLDEYSGGQIVKVADIALEDALIIDDTEGGLKYASTEAQQIDDEIYCYVENYYITGFEQDAFNEYITENFT